MKFLKPTLAAAGIALFSSCTAIKPAQDATIVRDCTGTYLRISGKDYQVCNTDLLKEIKDGATVKATFEKIENCKEFEGKSVCMMYHENEGLILIKTLN